MGFWSSTTRASERGCKPGRGSRSISIPLIMAALFALTLIGCRKAALPDYGQVPGFALTSQTGNEFQGDDLTGKVWVAEFFFTHCTGPCPRMNARFRQIQNQFIGSPDFRLVSFTVDPARDSAAALATYAHRFQAQQGRWYFLTGPMDRLNFLSRDVFKLGNVDGQLDHSTRFVLVDRKRHIRGFYRSDDPDNVHRLMDDIQSLLKENA